MNHGNDRNSGAATDEKRTIDPELLKVLVCPVTRTSLAYDADAQELISEAAGLAYSIRNGIPVMLLEEARKF